MKPEILVPRNIKPRLSRLKRSELDQLELAALSQHEGGSPLKESIRLKAVSLELAYSSTGRLRTDVYKFLKRELATLPRY